MPLQAAACTHVGMRREENQDQHAIVSELGLFLVADGMGGHRAGRLASQLACEGAIRAVETLQGATVPLAERLRHAMTSANREIWNAAQKDSDLSGMGTTLVALLFDDKRLALAHVGDSRAYLFRHGRLRALTDDHSIVGELLRRHEITEIDARGHPHRHVLTRALGVRSKTEPDLAEMTPEPGDVFVLCSDGLTGHVSDTEIAEHLMLEADPESTVQGLVDAAHQAGGLDNITVVLVRYATEG